MTGLQNDLRGVIIGCGAMGKNHARVLSMLPGVKIAGLSDTDGNAIMDTMEILGDVKLDADTDPCALVKKCAPDFVIIATPACTHYSVLKSIGDVVVQSGSAVFIEKPMFGTPHEGMLLNDDIGVDIRAKPFHVGFIERFNPAIIEAKKHIAGLGQLFTVDCIRSGPSPRRITDTDVIADLAIHDIDLIRALTGYAPVALDAAARTYRHGNWIDLVSARLRAGGTLCSVRADWVSSQRTRQIVVTGQNGQMKIDLLNGTVYLSYASGEERCNELIVVKTDTPGGALLEELKQFVECVRAGSCVCGVHWADAGWRSLECVEQIRMMGE